MHVNNSFIDLFATTLFYSFIYNLESLSLIIVEVKKKKQKSNNWVLAKRICEINLSTYIKRVVKHVTSKVWYTWITSEDLLSLQGWGVWQIDVDEVKNAQVEKKTNLVDLRLILISKKEKKRSKPSSNWGTIKPLPNVESLLIAHHSYACKSLLPNWMKSLRSWRR